MDFASIYIEFHPLVAEYTFFSASHGTLSREDHILDHQTGLNKYKT
jgi:hypothetical protein